MRRQRPDALIDHVDDDALGPGRQRPGERLNQDEGGPQIGFEVSVP